MTNRTAIIAGIRTPFVRSGTVFKDLTAIDLGVLAVRELMDRSGVRGEDVDHLVYGTVVHDPHAPNIATITKQPASFLMISILLNRPKQWTA